MNGRLRCLYTTHKCPSFSNLFYKKKNKKKHTHLKTKKTFRTLNKGQNCVLLQNQGVLAITVFAVTICQN